MRHRFIVGLLIGLAFSAGAALGVTNLPYISGTLTAGNCLKSGADALSIADTGAVCVGASANNTLTGINTFSKQVVATPVALSGTTVAVDMSLGNVFTLTLSGATTISNPTNMVAGQTVTFVLTQAAGGYAVTWSANYVWPGGTAPTMTATSGKRDIQTCIATSSTVCLFGPAAQNL
jgi:hypothetical protein